MSNQSVITTDKAESRPILTAALVDKEIKVLHEDELVDGAVITVDGTCVYVDIPPYGTGVIYGREFMNARDIIKNLNVGDSIKGKVVDPENHDGYIELSLKEARAAIVWKEAEEAMRSKSAFDVLVKSANKGGLILEWNGIEGFLPASQLSENNYPRVENGDKDAILKELKKLVGKPLSVMLISSNAKEGKLIFSEKGSNSTPSEKVNALARYAIGDELECEVTGAVDFGLFVKLEPGLEGLVHISEIDWALVDDPKRAYKIGDKVKAKVIEIKDGKISLSIKALKENPWKKAADSYKKDDLVNGVVIKFNKHGALVAIQEGVSGLVHHSEFGGEDKLRQALELGKSYNFTITNFEPNEQRMTLVLVK
jgi:small subunit ribosomal protein S1